MVDRCVELVLIAAPDRVFLRRIGERQRARGDVARGALGEHEVFPAADAHAVAEPAMRGFVGVRELIAHRVARDVPVWVVLHAAEEALAPDH